MASPLPSCISDTFCSHRQASWFILATLSPFFLPFLILSVPFLLLFLVPLSVFLFSLFLFYKVQVSLLPKLKRLHRPADKGVLSEGYHSTEQIAAAEGLDTPELDPLEDKVCEGLEGPNVQSAELHTDHEDEGTRATICELEEEKFGPSEEDLAAQDGAAEDKVEEKGIIEGPSVEAGSGESRHGGFPECEGPEVSNVRNVEMPASPEAQIDEGLQSPKRESGFSEETQEDIGTKLLRNDETEDDKQEHPPLYEEGLQSPTRESAFSEETQEDMGTKQLRTDKMEDDKQEHLPLYVEAHLSHTPEEDKPLIYEGESVDAPYSYDHRSSMPVEQQDQESVEDQHERQPSLHMHPFEEAWSKLPAIQVTEPTVQAETPVFADQTIEKPGEEESQEQLEINATPFAETVAHEHDREEPEPSSEKDLGLMKLGTELGPDEKEDISLPVEPFVKATEKGEPSLDSPEGHGQHIREAFTEETRDDEEPQNGSPAKDLAACFEAGPSVDREEGHASFAVPLPQVSHGGTEFQDRIQLEQTIMADINVIKKIVGFEGEPHASIAEQISALYMFLGMERYEWAADVDNLESAQTEIELLKVVVGVI